MVVTLGVWDGKSCLLRVISSARGCSKGLEDQWEASTLLLSETTALCVLP
ncbi:unnamed protein product, partial [Discosporangium mesarthrocarpum]